MSNVATSLLPLGLELASHMSDGWCAGVPRFYGRYKGTSTFLMDSTSGKANERGLCAVTTGREMQ